MHRLVLTVAVALLLTATPLCAEVMDKEPTTTAHWMFAVTAGGLAVLAWRWRWWAGGVVSTLALAELWLTYQELTDPIIAPAIRAEAGQRYFTNFYWSVAVGVAIQFVAACIAFRRRRRRLARGFLL